MEWQPNSEGINQILETLKETNNPNNEVQARVQQFNKIPEYPQYLMFIFKSKESNNVRASSGLLLKNLLRSNLSSVSAQALQYLKEQLPKALNDDEIIIRNTAGSIISTMVTEIGILNWPNLIPDLLESLASASPVLQEIVEDDGKDLNNQQLSFKGKNLFEAILLTSLPFFEHQNSALRAYSISILNNLALLGEPNFEQYLETYINKLAQRAQNDSSEPTIMTKISQGLAILVESYPRSLSSNLNFFVEFIVHCVNLKFNNTLNIEQNILDSLSLEAAEFFLVSADQEELANELLPLMNKIIPVLLNCMVYSDEDLFNLGFDPSSNEDPNMIKDKDDENKLRHAKGKKHDLESTEYEDDDDYDEDEEELYAEWNLRKCTAASLDVYSSLHREKILGVLFPLLEELMKSPDWRKRESSILAMGAIAEGCYGGMEPHLPQILPTLLNNLQDNHPLIRTITCWTLGRYCKFYFKNAENLQIYFNPILDGLLKMILDKHKRVQEAGCSALATIQEEGSAQLVPYVQVIVNTLLQAFNIYSSKTRLVIYDALGTLADSVGSQLAISPEFVQHILTPLINNWNLLIPQNKDSEFNAELIPLLECLSSVTVALGTHFLQYAKPTYERVLHFIQLIYSLQQEDFEYFDDLDKDYLVVSIDLIGAIIQAIGTQPSLELINSVQPNLIQIIAITLKDTSPDVLQSAYALLGDLAMFGFDIIQNHLNDIITALVNHVNLYIESRGDYKKTNTSVCNNAVWALGEIVLKLKSDPSKLDFVIEHLLGLLIHVLNCTKNPTDIHIPKTLLENVAVCIGRIALINPDKVAAHLPNFALLWCDSIKNIKDSLEKESAFLGFLKLVEKNPQPIVQCLNIFAYATVAWNNITPNLNEQFKKIWSGLKSMLNEQWDAFIASLDPNVKDRLLMRYQL